jgi:hypothetical protein
MDRCGAMGTSWRKAVDMAGRAAGCWMTHSGTNLFEICPVSIQISTNTLESPAFYYHRSLMVSAKTTRRVTAEGNEADVRLDVVILVLLPRQCPAHIIARVQKVQREEVSMSAAHQLESKCEPGKETVTHSSGDRILTR